MFIKSKKSPKDLNIITSKEYESNNTNIAKIDMPSILLFDPSLDVEIKLASMGLNFTTASLGSCVTLPVLLEHQYQEVLYEPCVPPNLHENDVFIFDLTSNKTVEFENKERTDKDIVVICEHPKSTYNPKPFALDLIAKEFESIFKNEKIVIVFLGSFTSEVYKMRYYTGTKERVDQIGPLDNISVLKKMPSSLRRFGKKMKLTNDETFIDQLLQKHVSNGAYYNVFQHPMQYSNIGEFEKASYFIPLLLNSNDEIVSFVLLAGNSTLYFFPDITNKSDFLEELLDVYLPSVSPKIFPYSGQFKWLENDDYFLPNEKKLLEQKNELKNRFVLENKKIDEKINTNHENFKFLHEMIFETGDNLVSAVSKFLNWLGYVDIIDVDNTNNELLEEDLQIETDKGLLIIEVKGVGGTSTDNDCAQISKIMHRRCKERNKFDVDALYIVNHQRYIPPKTRINPPFTTTQIRDAELAERGLLTTYELFKSFFLIEAGILNKKNVIEQLHEIGLVDLTANSFLSLGKPSKLFKEGMVAIIDDINGIRVEKGMEIVIRDGDVYQKAILEDIQINNKSVSFAEQGEVGLLLNQKIKKSTNLLVKKMA
ncbi:hypothetical protein [Sodalis sp. dw_96]|uniref:hypothetical protein n=1 Tax=Sodalis sp. dw_96 TaxID=2719794 RepID=UPI001BD4B79D|nr:hypothetical protein [Sodalis sp. dw_96]